MNTVLSLACWISCSVSVIKLGLYNIFPLQNPTGWLYRISLCFVVVDVSGGRPEVTLPQRPAPILGLCILGFPLWAPPKFVALDLGLGSAPQSTLHPRLNYLWRWFKGCSTLSQECCPSSTSCSHVEKKGSLEESWGTFGGQGLLGHIRALLVTS